MYRVEDKFICTQNEFFILDKMLQTIMPLDANSGEDGYIVTSVYFDDYYDSHLQDVYEGKQERRKYRIRIYNHNYNRISLEIKFKKNNRIMKRAKIISLEEMQALMEGNNIPGQNSDDPDDPVMLFNLAIKNDGLKPKVIVEYDRKAYVHELGNVRITIDKNVRYSTDFTSFQHQKIYYCSPLRENRDVLEVKYDAFLPDFIAGVLELGNMQQLSFSKYTLCREDVMQCQ